MSESRVDGDVQIAQYGLGGEDAQAVRQAIVLQLLIFGLQIDKSRQGDAFHEQDCLDAYQAELNQRLLQMAESGRQVIGCYGAWLQDFMQQQTN